MNAEYAIRAIAKTRMTAWEKATPSPMIQLPRENPYIPTDLALLPFNRETHNAENPLLLHLDEGSKIYFAQDTRYLVPEIAHTFTFQSPLLQNTAKAQVLADLYIRALTEKLSSPLSMAALGGLRSSFAIDDFTLQLRVIGYNDKAPLLLHTIFQNLKGVKCAKEEFEIYRTSLAADYDNSSKELPVRQAMEQLDAILFSTPTDEDKYRAIQNVSFEEFSDFASHLFDSAYTQAVLYGNLDQRQAHELWKTLEETLSTTAFPEKEHCKRKVLLLSEKHGPFKLVDTTDRAGSGVLLLLQEGPFTYENKAIQQILGTALSDAFFDTLRTKQQTAYIAKAWNTEEERQLMQFFAVQSSTHTPTDLLARFELFLEDFNKNLTIRIPEGRFESIRSNLITLLKMPPENMPGMGALLNTLAFDYEDFKRIEKRIETMKSLSYETFCQVSRQLLSRDNPRRLAVLIEGVLAPENDFHYETVGKEELQTMGAFVTVK